MTLFEKEHHDVDEILNWLGTPSTRRYNRAQELYESSAKPTGDIQSTDPNPINQGAVDLRNLIECLRTPEYEMSAISQFQKELPQVQDRDDLVQLMLRIAHAGESSTTIGVAIECRQMPGSFTTSSPRCEDTRTRWGSALPCPTWQGCKPRSKSLRNYPENPALS